MDHRDLLDKYATVRGVGLDAVDIRAVLGREFGREIELDQLLRSQTFGEMLDAVTT